MKKKKILVLVSILSAIAFGAYADLPHGLGVTVPKVDDKDGSPTSDYKIAGDIVLDVSENKFYGHDTSGGWIDLGAGHQSVVARYTRSTTQSLSSGVVTVVDFATSTYDSDSAVTTGSNWNFTAPVAGTYSVSAAIALASASWTAATDIFTIYIFKTPSGGSAAEYSRGQKPVYVNGTYVNTIAISDEVQLAAGDSIDIRVHQNTGGAVNINGTSFLNRVSIAWVGDN